MNERGRDDTELLAAVARLVVIPDYDSGGREGPGPHVHTYREGQPGLLLGAHWRLTAVMAAMRRHGVQEAGPRATAAGHGLVLRDERGLVFFAVRAADEARGQEQRGGDYDGG